MDTSFPAWWFDPANVEHSKLCECEADIPMGWTDVINPDSRTDENIWNPTGAAEKQEREERDRAFYGLISELVANGFTVDDVRSACASWTRSNLKSEQAPEPIIVEKLEIPLEPQPIETETPVSAASLLDQHQKTVNKATKGKKGRR